MTCSLRNVLTPLAAARAALGWLAVLALWALAGLLEPPAPAPVLLVALTGTVAVMVFASIGVVHQAEKLAHRLGDPYGSLVLTLTIVTVEVALVCAVMLGPGEHSTIARDSVTAVSMIILNLVVGLCLLVGGLAHGGMRHHRTGVSTYVALLVVLCTLSFALPAQVGTGGAFTTWQEIPVIVTALGCYAFFLWRQTGSQSEDFTEARPPLHTRGDRAVGQESPVRRTPIGETVRTHRRELLLRFSVLLVTVLPVVLLSHDMAALLDDGLSRTGAPPALAGVLIAGVVFLPESLTALGAARRGEIQRVSNLCHGALVSTVGLTIPAVLVIGMLTGQTVVLAESPVNLMLLAATLGLSALTATSPRVNAVHGACHLVLFVAYVLAVFS